MSKKQRERLLKTFNPTGKKYESTFGASILSKFGWKEGQGLGKSEDGIKKPVSIKKVEGTSGLGSSKSDEWHNWWDDMYNELASKIQVKKTTEKSTKKTRKKIKKKDNTKD
ncbi:G-patch domain protein [Theileria parva strain Muguga]|uniref:G-patch domain protein n=1 Tax=Theileria parva strain Muguga TaxID=333668 RepID=UPI001C61CAE2|nr:G-patch domain protein [Theileria parva strain Muguga]KAF5153447.1 G-patch domain protein [Theileria parva strain Muguga]